MYSSRQRDNSVGRAIEVDILKCVLVYALGLSITFVLAMLLGAMFHKAEIFGEFVIMGMALWTLRDVLPISWIVGKLGND